MVQLEKQILALSPSEREQLAAFAWESLVADPTASGNREIDAEGLKTAAERDAEIEKGRVQPIDHAEFLRATGSVAK